MNHWIIAPVVLPAILAPILAFVMRHDYVLARVFSVAGTVALTCIALGLALLGCVVALVDTLSGAGVPAGHAGLALSSATALATGAVAGGVGLAMVLGHWYLTVPNLAVSHLKRLNRVTIVSMLVCLALVIVSCLTFGDNEDERGSLLFGPTGIFYLSARVAVGILMPLLFAWMAASSLRYENTRSATGILYASTVLVLIGAAVSVALQDSWGVPL